MFSRCQRVLSSIFASLAMPLIFCQPVSINDRVQKPLEWPAATAESRPWSYWWWHGSAVDPTNLSRELNRYRDAGWGGLHIIPIYGTKGWEEKNISYLSSKWMDMLLYTVTEAKRLNLGVDMTTGSGWCFGGPQVSDTDANAAVVVKTYDLAAGQQLSDQIVRGSLQALMAFSADGKSLDLLPHLGTDDRLRWSPGEGTWRIYAVSQRPSGQQVKRPAPGGEGHMLNLIYGKAMPRFLQRFEEAFAAYRGPLPRSMYHDSYEYRSNWSPDFLVQFEKRRGYRLQDELPQLFGKNDSDRVARVKSDYRETISDIQIETSLPAWVSWSHARGMLTRNEAHGSPGNLLDLYALADIPETEMFYKDRNLLVSKVASSAAHITAKRLVSSETGTWLKEHFTETLADMKFLLDDLFLSGVNHILYHGSCYSPDEAAWPGWLFYASYEMNPRNPIWRDVPGLNTYATRCQSILQHGRPDNDILLYWPIYDRWHNPKELVQNFTVHARDWFENEPFGILAQKLWQRGYAFDYVSDRQLAQARALGGEIETAGGRYRVVLVPKCVHMPLPTFEKLISLARDGATILFEGQLPQDVPGWRELERRRGILKKLQEGWTWTDSAAGKLKTLQPGKGSLLVGEWETVLEQAKVIRESLTDRPGLFCIRRAFSGGRHYFIANRGEQVVNGWLPLSLAAKSVIILDPMSGKTGVAAIRPKQSDTTEVYLQLQPGEAIILRVFSDRNIRGTRWPYSGSLGNSIELKGTWNVEFLQGGPNLPAAYETAKLVSWTQSSSEAESFAGTARYRLHFEAPSQAGDSWILDLGKVCQSARVRLNGQDLGISYTPPYRVAAVKLRRGSNLLEVEVTNVAANRIRDLDRRKVNWKIFSDINFVNIDYKPFDASGWPLTDAGLLGPVTITPCKAFALGSK